MGGKPTPYCKRSYKQCQHATHLVHGQRQRSNTYEAVVREQPVQGMQRPHCTPMILVGADKNYFGPFWGNKMQFDSFGAAFSGLSSEIPTYTPGAARAGMYQNG